jgi:hypothetical protein
LNEIIGRRVKAALDNLTAIVVFYHCCRPDFRRRRRQWDQSSCSAQLTEGRLKKLGLFKKPDFWSDLPIATG